MRFLTSTLARNFAETLWGRGGTSSTRTNRKGAFYFSCSGHGGYLVDGDALTAEEREAIDRYKLPEEVRVLVQTRAEGETILLVVNPFSFHARRYSYNPALGPVYWTTLPLYVFEEDCDWTILEKFTDIRDDFHAQQEKDPEKAEAYRANRDHAFSVWCDPESPLYHKNQAA